MSNIYLDASGVPRSVRLEYDGPRSVRLEYDGPRTLDLSAESLRHFITCLEGGPELYNMGRAFGQGVVDALKDAGWVAPCPPESPPYCTVCGSERCQCDSL